MNIPHDVGLRSPRRTWWHWLLTFANVGLIATAAAVLYRMLNHLDVARVAAAVSATSWTQIALASALVTASYGLLTLYDFLALRTHGYTSIRYRTAALAGFTSYAIGHNVGATTIVAGAVRYRIYAPQGLDAIAVARVCVVAGLTFWLGNATMLGLGVALHPEAAAMIDQLPEGMNRAAALGLLVALVLYTTWVWRGGRRLGNRKLSVALPDGPSTLLQISIGAADLACSAMALYMLMPAAYAGDFMHFVVIFVCATLLGFASHAPGGIGVFDAAMLIGLPDLDRAELVAALVVFRVLYYLLPFAVALALLAARELARVRRELHLRVRRPARLAQSYPATSAGVRRPPALRNPP